MTTPAPEDREQVEELLDEKNAAQRAEADAENVDPADRPTGTR